MPDQTSLEDVLDVLEQLTDSTFLLVHQLEKGYRYDDQKAVVNFVLQDAIATLRQYGVNPEGCDQCGSRDPRTSPWHMNHCRQGEVA